MFFGLFFFPSLAKQNQITVSLLQPLESVRFSKSLHAIEKVSCFSKHALQEVRWWESRNHGCSCFCAVVSSWKSGASIRFDCVKC